MFAEVLRLAGAGPDDDRWSRIATLALGLTLDELAELARALESWPDESAHLGRAEVSDAAIEGLCAGAGLPRLSALGLDHNRIGPEGARILSSTPRLSGLVRLSLACNPIGAEGALAIASSPHLGALRSLDLHDTGLDDAGARRLLDSGGLERLEILDLGGNPLDASLLQAALATASGPLPRIVF